MKSSKDFKIDEVVNYAFNFYSQNGRSLESQDICIAKIMQMTGLDYATSIDIQSPILSILMYNEMVGISNQITSQLHNTVSGIIGQRLHSINISNIQSKISSQSVQLPDQIQSFSEMIHNKHKSIIGYHGTKELYSSGNNLGMHKLLTHIQNKVNIQDVNAITLYDNNLKDFDIDYMRSVITYYHFNLEALYLNCNPIGDKTVTHLLSGVINAPQYRNVKELNLSQCDLGDKSAEMLSFSLAKGDMPATKYIDVSGNNITKDGETKLVQALKGKVQDMIIITKKLEQNSKLFPGIGTKDEKIAIYKEFIKQGIEKGTYDKGIVVDKSLWGEIKNIINSIEGSGYAAMGFVKCNWKPEEMVKSYAQDKITAKISKAFSKILGQFTDIEGIVSCYLEASDAGWTSPPGMKTVQHELCVLGEQEFCGE